MDMVDKKLEQVERLLRAERGVELSPSFKQRVMGAISRLPDPELLAPPAAARDLGYFFRLLGVSGVVAIVLIVGGLTALFWPGATDLLAAYSWELGELKLSLSIGETALSASLLSVLVVAAAALFMAGVGAYTAKNHMIGA